MANTKLVPPEWQTVSRGRILKIALSIYTQWSMVLQEYGKHKKLGYESIREMQDDVRRDIERIDSDNSTKALTTLTNLAFNLAAFAQRTGVVYTVSIPNLLTDSPLWKRRLGDYVTGRDTVQEPAAANESNTKPDFASDGAEAAGKIETDGVFIRLTKEQMDEVMRMRLPLQAPIAHVNNTNNASHSDNADGEALPKGVPTDPRFESNGMYHGLRREGNETTRRPSIVAYKMSEIGSWIPWAYGYKVGPMSIWALKFEDDSILDIVGGWRLKPDSES